MGNSIKDILRENYDSVIAMERLNEALGRIDSSFQFALAGQPEKARQQYVENWPAYEAALAKEGENITLPGERELVDRLEELTRRYRRHGDVFFRALGPAVPSGLVAAAAIGPAQLLPLLSAYSGPLPYFGRSGLLDAFDAIKTISGKILTLNQNNMEEASRSARGLARNSLIGFGVGLAATAVLAVVLVLNTGRTILGPIRAATQSALAIGAGNLDQVVPVRSRTSWANWPRRSTPWPASCAITARPTTPGCCAPSGPARRPSTRFPTRSWSSIRRARWKWPTRPPGACSAWSAGRTAAPGPRLAAARAAARTAARRPARQQRPYLPEGFDRLVLAPTPDGQEHVFLPRILPIRDPYGNTLGAAVLLQDVTRFRLLDQIKSDLVATVSHELKTPLTSIRLAVHLLLEETVGPLTPKQTELLLDARDNAERLLAMINNLLDLARLEQGREQLDLHARAPAALLQAAADAIRPGPRTRASTVEVEAPPDLPAGGRAMPSGWGTPWATCSTTP